MLARCRRQIIKAGGSHGHLLHLAGQAEEEWGKPSLAKTSSTNTERVFPAKGGGVAVREEKQGNDDGGHHEGGNPP